MEVITPYPSKVYSGGMFESKSEGTFSPLHNQDGRKGLFVDRGVGSARLFKSASATTFTSDHRLDSEAKVYKPIPFPPLQYVIKSLLFLSLGLVFHISDFPF